MSNFSFNHRLLLAVGVGVPVAIFFAARSAASWRPQLIGKQGDTIMPSSSYLRLSPDEKWLMSEGENLRKGHTEINSYLWSLFGGEQKRVFRGRDAIFSSDSRLIASIDDSSSEIFLNDLSGQRWKKYVLAPINLDLRFVLNNRAIQYQDDEFSPPESAIQLDVKNGRVIGREKLPPPLWENQYGNKDKDGISVRSGVSFLPSGAGRRGFSFKVKGKEDKWELAPDGSHLWVSDGAKSHVDVLDARTGREAWSYNSADVFSGEFNCYPSWDKTGKTLTTIENDTLVVRDSADGKIVLSHKNNLRAPLRSWAFTKEGNTVYLMNAKGEIFRQRLR